MHKLLIIIMRTLQEKIDLFFKNGNNGIKLWNRYVSIINPDFRSADFRSADFSSANFSSANFSYAYFNANTIGLLLVCPEEGSYIAWKKASGYIVKLFIPNNALRSSATTLKCRASRAKCMAIETKNGSNSNLKMIASSRDSKFIYEVGKYIEVKDFDNNRWNECSTGIHHFISRKLAECWD